MLPAITIAALADETPKAAEAGSKRPKICLVLSGGGARGAAHVGVLKVLEEYRVPVDCIVGTSMGALVGAGYATGTSVAEMEKINAEITTELLFKEAPPRDEQSMRRKSDDYLPYIGPEIGIGDKGFGLPKGVVTGVQLETVLRRLAKAKGYHNFDKLPIPFRAVATDLVTGKEVVFKNGEIANVMRASMSVPGAVAPAEFGGKMLVDGMLTKNLPVEVARSMGADIIIAVNVGTPLLKRDELTSILGVSGQMLSILTEQNVQVSLARLKPADILITPELGDYSTGDFDNLPKIAPLGEEAARKQAERLAQLSLPPDEYAALRKRQTVAVLPDLSPVDEIRFEDLKRVNPKSVQEVMVTKVGQPIDQKVLDGDMRRIYGTGDFEHVNYRLFDDSGKRVLAVDAVEKSWGPDYLHFGLGLSSDFKGDAFYNLLATYRKTWINSLGAEWRTDVQFGHTGILYTEFYQPLNFEGWWFFVAPNAGIARRSTYLYQGEERLASYDISSDHVAMEGGIQFRQYGTLRLGIEGGKTEPKLDTGPQSLSPGEPSVAQGAYTAKLIFDRMDNVNFPRMGWGGRLNVYDSTSQLGAAVDYTKWGADLNAVYSYNNHTFNFALKAGGKTGTNPLPNYDQFQWGGFMRQSGYRTDQLYGENLSYGRLMYYHRIMRGTLLEGAYGGFSLEAGKVGDPLVPGSPDGLLKSGSIFVAADSPVGPVYLGYGHAQDGNSSWYFYLGLPY
ncbi:MAG: patatin-like phospholipase family protein [Gallionella sp.]